MKTVECGQGGTLSAPPLVAEIPHFRGEDKHLTRKIFGIPALLIFFFFSALHRAPLFVGLLSSERSSHQFDGSLKERDET